MGIKGLTSFIDILDDEREFLELKRLCDCSLLIDGYGFLHQIYFKFRIDCEYGGNYDQLAFQLHEFFAKLQKCNIKSYVLMDGARDLQDKKLATTLKRARQRITDSLIETNCDSHKENLKKKELEIVIENFKGKKIKSILPINAFLCFINVLDSFNIPYYQCFFEADYELAYLANYLNCPVLSCDSDFFIFNLKAGYLSLDYLNFDLHSWDNCEEEIEKRVSDTKYYICGNLYKIDAFMSAFKLNNIEILPIIAVLFGNDYVDSKFFDSLLNTFKHENNNQRNSSRNKKLSLFKKLLNWLNEFNTTKECLDLMLNFMKKEQHEELLEIVTNSIDSYLLRKKIHISSILKQLKIDSDSNIDELAQGSELPSSIMQSFYEPFNKLYYPRFFLDVLIHRKLIFSCQIEYVFWSSSYLSSIEIRKYLYYLLLKNYDRDCEQCMQVKEYLRYRNEIRIYEIDLNSDNFAQIDTQKSFMLSLLDLLKFTDRQQECFVQHSSGLSMQLKYLFILIYYWINSSNKNEEGQNVKNLNLVRTFIVSYIKCSIIDKIYKSVKREDNNKMESVHHDSTEANNNKNYEFYTNEIDKYLRNESNLEYLKEIYVKLNSYKEISNKHLVNSFKIIHSLCEFQAIYQSVFYFQRFFDSFCATGEGVGEFIGLEKFFNGTFLTNFGQELEIRSNPNLFIEELFGRKSILTSFYEFLYEKYSEVFKKSDCDTDKKEPDKAIVTKKKLKQEKRKAKRLENLNQEKTANETPEKAADEVSTIET